MVPVHHAVINHRLRVVVHQLLWRWSETRKGVEIPALVDLTAHLVITLVEVDLVNGDSADLIQGSEGNKYTPLNG